MFVLKKNRYQSPNFKRTLYNFIQLYKYKTHTFISRCMGMSGCRINNKTVGSLLQNWGFHCKNNFTAFLGYNYCFLYHY